MARARPPAQIADRRAGSRHRHRHPCPHAFGRDDRPAEQAARTGCHRARDAGRGRRLDRRARGAQARQGYLKDFLFDPGLVDTKVGILSGGERSRLLLAREFARTANLLVLDEPTNDLDLETLDLLQEVIADYEGTVLIVSHDRDFLDRTVTVTLGLDGSRQGGHYRRRLCRLGSEAQTGVSKGQAGSTGLDGATSAV
jgi:ATPase subunit of ABC transporter with duplicated ATPase domains